MTDLAHWGRPVSEKTNSSCGEISISQETQEKIRNFPSQCTNFFTVEAAADLFRTNYCRKPPTVVSIPHTPHTFQNPSLLSYHVQTPTKQYQKSPTEQQRSTKFNRFLVTVKTIQYPYLSILRIFTLVQWYCQDSKY